ncbi:hypothetical protein [Cellulomonas sp. URHB0016]
MALTKAAISLIGRIHPEIFDILGNPYGPYGHVGGLHAGLQLHAAHAATELNPQPLPPLAVGFQAGQDLFRLARTASQLRVAFDPDLDDWCPTPPRPPGGWGPWPIGPRPEPWLAEYNLGLALFLEASQSAWEQTDAARALEKAHDIAFDAAQQGLAG